MKKSRQNTREISPMPAANCVTILAILAEMARRVNLNITKIELTPISGGWLASEKAAPDSTA